MNLRDKSQNSFDLLSLERIIPRPPIPGKDGGIELFFKSGTSTAVWYDSKAAWEADVNYIRRYLESCCLPRTSATITK